MPGAGGAKADGRVLRGRRNREAVVEALLGLVAEGDLNPTARAIAERAGISRRSVFQHFADVESIYEAAGHRVGATLLPLLQPVDTTLPLARRVEAFFGVRQALLETVDPIARAARVREPFSPQLQASRRRLSLMMREQCRQVFAPELAEHPGADGEELVSALAGAMSWSLWNHLRADLEVGDEEALAVMTRLVAGLLDTGDVRVKAAVAPH
jgi:TetR/AcrR family transcriptional regulator, regulator of autoinduction and epiphytic fitness